jgi:hypothetical protein
MGWLIAVFICSSLAVIAIVAFDGYGPPIYKRLIARRLAKQVLRMHDSYCSNHESELICNKLTGQQTILTYIPDLKDFRRWWMTRVELAHLIARSLSNRIVSFDCSFPGLLYVKFDDSIAIKLIINSYQGIY